MMKIFFTIVLLLGLLNAQEEMGLRGGSCTLTQKGSVVVSFEAYKTARKIGVSGVFDRVKYTSNAKSGKNFRDIFVGSSVDIDSTSVNSKMKLRDNRLVKFFFSKLSSKTIVAKILDYKPNKRFKGKPKTGIFMVEISMNGISKIVQMQYSFSKGIMKADGVIDIIDFSASDALSAINKACYMEHAGKTWSEVTIGFTTKVDYSLCNVIR